MDRGLARIDAQSSVTDTLNAGVEEILQLGDFAGTFHLTPPHMSQIGPRVFVAEFGQDPEWIRLYRSHDVRQHDPIPDHVMRTGKVMTYAEALGEVELTADQAAFIEKVKAAGLFDSVAIPIYGPFDFDNYLSLHLRRPIRREDDGLIQRVVAIAEIANRRVAQLLEQKTALEISLSEREQQVLNWMGQSKSNGDIATILGIAASTVDTYVRRVFAKLETNDRIAAVLKGVRLGLIRF
jgi:DNA-binding CsgD family transcriptional regulator